jgi:hypothetical protein
MLTAPCPPQGKGVQTRRNASSPLRSTRPSLLDVRFTGDPWVASGPEGAAALCLDDYCLVRVIVSPLDVPSFYQTVLRMRQARCRGRLNPARVESAYH